MASYSLSGTGVQALSAGVTALHVTISTLPAQPILGTANPGNYGGVAMLRLGDGTGFFQALPVEGGPQWLAVPNGCTQLGYAVQPGAAISVAEVLGGVPPFGGPGSLASLSDVALASLADAQVLTYHTATSKWINATPAGGSGGPPTIPAARVWRNTTFSIAASAVGRVPFNQLQFDSDTLWNSATPDRLTINTAGVYLVVGGSRVTGTGIISYNLQVNAATVIASVIDTTSNNMGLLSTIYQFAHGDYVSLAIYNGTSATQTTTSSDTSSGGDVASPHLGVAKIG